ncbi:phytanoyl-CoA dioxygenase family protein [Paenibacillus sp. OV219]|uniref:phytanoyl-CoA dioxygenase family protein n=1 Tax=Paenibacillus sp. OV219 TaxID=1884377 RepID=UPI0008BDD0FB|nr:phytanoyl-CoA dioxygenase family protein [Paenibacillus sp. OV219]SEO63043.1 Phytanoyl-CoA dioxygenase (PhyH) [Paenibacillus sp. OV219]
MTVQSIDLSLHIAEFKQNGFTVFKQLIDQKQVSIWKEKIPQIREEIFGEQVKSHYTVSDMVERYPTMMLPLTANPVILDFMESVMGPFIQIGDNNLNMFAPVAKEDVLNEVNGWHRDMYAFVPTGTDYQIPRQVLALTYLEDMTEETGPLRVLAGTHRKETVMTAEEKSKPHPDEELLSLKSGDVIVFSGLLHSGTVNTSDRYRLLMGGMYTYSWYKHDCNFNGPNIQRLIEQATERNDRRMLRLLGGYGEVEQRRTNSGFTLADETQWKKWIAEDKAALKGPGDWWRTPQGT